MHPVLGLIVDHLIRLVCVAGGVALEWPGDSWDVRQVGRRASQGRCPTLQEELPVIDDSGASRRGAEQSSSGGRGVVVGQMRRVMDSDPPDGRDIPALGGLASR